MEAVERYGAWRGGAMAAWRVLRCHPLATGGLDPVVKAGVGNTTHSQKARINGAPTPVSTITNPEMTSY
jgi:putative component of membrane protein insertase Oxa1/YidC/SpoIIIJ protein YidD